MSATIARNLPAHRFRGLPYFHVQRAFGVAFGAQKQARGQGSSLEFLSSERAVAMDADVEMQEGGLWFIGSVYSHDTSPFAARLETATFN